MKEWQHLFWLRMSPLQSSKFNIFSFTEKNRESCSTNSQQQIIFQKNKKSISSTQSTDILKLDRDTQKSLLLRIKSSTAKNTEKKESKEGRKKVLGFFIFRAGRLGFIFRI